MTNVQIANSDLWLANLLDSNDLLANELPKDLVNNLADQSPAEPTESNVNPDRMIGRFIEQKYLVEALICNQELSSIYQVSCGDRNLIVKILHLDCTDNQELREKFLWQMQAIACIQTQKVVRVLEYGTDFLPLCALLNSQDDDHQDRNSDREVPYIVTEICSYPTLADRLKSDQLKTETNRWEVVDGISLILNLIKSLQSLYAGAYLRSESGAIIRPVRLWHQNLKPSNIFLGDLFIQLSDFGGYQLLFLPEQGDWTYAAPEDWQQNYLPRDERRDVYGCGLILYELLSGRSPYQLPPSSTAEQWQAAIAFDPIPNFNSALAIPRSLELLILRCLEKDPQHRFANLKQLQLELEEIAQIPKSTKSKPKRSLFQPAYILGLGLTATAATLGYFAFQSQTEVQPEIQAEIQPGRKFAVQEKAITAPNTVIEPSTKPFTPSSQALLGKSGIKPEIKIGIKTGEIKNRIVKNSLTKPVPVKILSKTTSKTELKPQIKSPAQFVLSPKVESKPNSVKPDLNRSIQPPAIIATDKPEGIGTPVFPTFKPFPIPVAKRVEIIPPPTASFFPKPLAQPNTKLIPPPEIAATNLQDQAISKQLQLSIPVSDQNIANFDQLMQRSAELAAQTINRDFAQYPQRQELQIAILGDRNGQEVPLLLAKVTRSQWQTNGNISKWANFIIKSESLLAAIPVPKAKLNR